MLTREVFPLCELKGVFIKDLPESNIFEEMLNVNQQYNMNDNPKNKILMS